MVPLMELAFAKSLMTTPSSMVHKSDGVSEETYLCKVSGDYIITNCIKTNGTFEATCLCQVSDDYTFTSGIEEAHSGW